MRSIGWLLIITATAWAQVKAPAPPEKLHVDVRYRIEADRDGRARTYRAMMAELQSLGFTPDDRDDGDLDILDPNADRLAGTIPSGKLEALQKALAIQTVLTRPVDQPLPDDPAKPVQISLTLASGLDPITQRRLQEQVIVQLTKLGFIPAIGFDDRQFTRVRGTVPAGQVLNLLKDLRGLPAGWLLQALPRNQLPQPLANLLPIRLIEIQPEQEATAPLALPPATSPKFTSGLRLALADPAFTAKPMRVEAALAQPIDNQRAYRIQINVQLPGVLIEGIVGTLVTFSVPTIKDLEGLASRPEILSLRLPPSAVNTVLPGTAAGDPLASTHIRDIQNRGYRGQGRKLVVIGGGFDAAQLPKNSVLVDLTVELHPDLDAAPVNAAFDATAAALAAHRAAPGAQLIAVRLHPTAFHQLFTVAHAILGDETLSTAQVARAEVLLAVFEDLNRRRDYLNAEYAEAFGNLSDDEKPRTRREKVLADLERFKVEETAFRTRYDKFQALRQGLLTLRGATAIANTLTWDDGYPTDGLSEFARLLDDKFTPQRGRTVTPTWSQAASESTWSVWAGPAYDTDGDRILDFAPPGTPLPAGSWTHELNFLGSLGYGMVNPELTQGSRFTITIQWREPHDPNLVLIREPVINFQLQLLRQTDPTGEKFATDEFMLVAAGEGAPVRLLRTPAAGVYEQTLEVTLPSAGHHALRVVMDTSSAGRFAAETRLTEISPKITIKPAGGSTEKLIFRSFMASRPGVGVPGDARGAFTVGRCDAQGRSLSLLGAGPGVQLRAKPDLLLFGDGAGSSAATAAGLAVILADVGVRPSQFVGTTAVQANGTLLLPTDWIASVPARR